MLGVMLDKGIVKRTKTPRGYLWSAGVTRERTANTLVDKLVDGVFEGSTQRLIAHLVENTPLGEKELAEITAMIHSKPKPPKPAGGK